MFGLVCVMLGLLGDSSFRLVIFVFGCLSGCAVVVLGVSCLVGWFRCLVGNAPGFCAFACRCGVSGLIVLVLVASLAI